LEIFPTKCAFKVLFLVLFHDFFKLFDNLFGERPANN
jgi:hypothetical protein